MPANRAWHETNRTYPFAVGLGSVIVLYGLLIALNPWLPQVAAVGSFLVFVMSFVAVSPEPNHKSSGNAAEPSPTMCVIFALMVDVPVDVPAW